MTRIGRRRAVRGSLTATSASTSRSVFWKAESMFREQNSIVLRRSLGGWEVVVLEAGKEERHRFETQEEANNFIADQLAAGTGLPSLTSHDRRI